jgi:hypothetical protein
MTDNDISQTITAGRGFPRLALGLAWLASALAVGAIGWLLVAITDRRGDSLPGWLLLGLAALGLVALAGVVSNRHRDVTLSFSMVASAAFVLVGMAAVILAVARGGSFVDDLLLVGGIPVVAGLVTGQLGRRSRGMSR